MVKKVLLAIILSVAIALIYHIKPSKFVFSDIYLNEDETSTTLAKFREEPTQFIDVGDHKVEYYATGVGDTAILFLHGMGGSYDIWWQQIEYFKATHHIVSFTYPDVRTLKELSEVINSILEKEKIKNVIAVGSSLGGYLAQYYVKNNENRVIKMSLGNTFPPNDENKSKNATLVAIMKYMPDWLAINQIRKKYNNDVVPAAENSLLVKAFLNELLGDRVSKKAFISRYYCVTDTFTVHNTLKTPIQIIESDNDPLVGENLRFLLKKTYPQASVVTLKNKGHFPYLNDSDSYNAILREFIE